jgi:hypothetical protein
VALSPKLSTDPKDLVGGLTLPSECVSLNRLVLGMIPS